MSIVFTSFKHPKLPISIKIPVTLLQIVYICMTDTAISRICEFEFVNYLFANLLVAWLKSLFKNTVDPHQLASDEDLWSLSTLFSTLIKKHAAMLQVNTIKNCGGYMYITWVKVFRIIPDYSFLRLVFHRKSASKYWIRQIIKAFFDIFSYHIFKISIFKFRILEISTFHPWKCVAC